MNPVAALYLAVILAACIGMVGGWIARDIIYRDEQQKLEQRLQQRRPDC